MEKLIALFPGQGIQEQKMAIDLFDNYQCVRDLFEMASEINNVDFYKILTTYSTNELLPTNISQAVITLANISSIQALKEEGYSFVATAGFSLGEVSSYYLSNIIGLEDLFKIVKKRGEITQKACVEVKKQYGETIMAAIINLNSSQVCDCIYNAKVNHLYVANDNTEKQVVVAGLKKDLAIVEPFFKEVGARRIISLNVDGPFHTPLLKNAEIEFNEYLKNIKVRTPSIEVFSNVTGKVETEFNSLIGKQLTHTVKWLDISKEIKNKYTNRIVECGNKKVLKNFFKQLDVEVYSCTNSKEIKEMKNG